MKLSWRSRARTDLANQIAFVEKRNPAAAARLLADVLASTELLTLFPEMGRQSRKRGVREFLPKGTPYVVIYTSVRDEVRILRLFHVSQGRP